MSLVLNLPPELETELLAGASRMGLPLPEYVKRLLLVGRPPEATLRPSLSVPSQFTLPVPAATLPAAQNGEKDDAQNSIQRKRVVPE